MLNIKELIEADEDGELWKRVIRLLDTDRLCKLDRIKNQKARAACAGAGILLQWAYFVYERFSHSEKKISAVFQDEICGDNEDDPGACGVEFVTVKEIVDQMKEKYEFQVIYRQNGKPYIEACPFFYNLSHSEDYVFCGVSEGEIGVDIQEMKQGKCGEAERESKLAKRFFAEEEYRRLLAEKERANMVQMFYRLWTRKEALGKLGGEGLLNTIGKNLLTESMHDGEEDQEGHLWEEYLIDGYALSVCRDSCRAKRAVKKFGQIQVQRLETL